MTGPHPARVSFLFSSFYAFKLFYKMLTIQTLKSQRDLSLSTKEIDVWLWKTLRTC